MLHLNCLGFCRVDEYLELLNQFLPLTPVIMHGESDLMPFKAGNFPSQLGRTLRVAIFGNDGLVDDMIDSSRSQTRREVDSNLVKMFEG